MSLLPPLAGNRPLLGLMPDAIDGRRVLLMRGDASDTMSGARDVDVEDALQNTQRTFQYVLKDRATIAEFWEFYKARKARAEAFFYPTWRWECALYSYEMPNFGSYYAHITHSRFASALARSNSLRWFIIQRGLAWHVHAMDEVIEDIAPGIDRIHLFNFGEPSQSTPDVPNIGYVPGMRIDYSYKVHWLRYGRFDSDRCELVFAGEDLAFATVTLIETPGEEPLP